jgi:hypothetical protein
MNYYPVGSYVAVGLRCAIDSSLFRYDVSTPEVQQFLERKGIQRLCVGLTETARGCIHTSMLYKVEACYHDAPEFVNCRTFIKWVYAQNGVWIPSNIRALGKNTEEHDEDRIEGDLVIAKDSASPSGRHMGMVTSEKTVIHANQGVNVIEEDFEKFISEGLVGIRRIIVDPDKIITFSCPSNLEIEWSGDIEALIYRGLKKY